MQSYSFRMCGHSDESYKGYDSSYTQFPWYRSHSSPYVVGPDASAKRIIAHQHLVPIPPPISANRTTQ
ncbi:hypothetical protein HanRHA438_Chr16g0779591 [Helianthus annuus]|nr:hypothetical protein HanIR_Chr16g0833881 [Helianthus annuus]KAJ0837566.1 hypothetical protein HanRHA438_Chr16g0779591 [Helianthus annuus]